MIMRKASWFNVVSVALGLAFLYLPIVILVIYSFNASRLVTVWGGFSARWYGALVENEKYRDAALTSLEIAVMAATISGPTSLRRYGTSCMFSMYTASTPDSV